MNPLRFRHLILPAILFILPLITVPLQAQTGSLSGTVSSNGQPVISATVGIKALGKGSFTDSTGHFRLNTLPAGSHTLYISSVGYRSLEKEILITADEELKLDLQLREEVTELNQVVVTGTLKETTIRQSPVKVNSISGDVLRKSGAGNLMEAVNYINGLYKQVDCAVCGTDNIRINGMEGPYTSVLIDGMPVMGALASVYGLNGISSDIISSIEIIKGPNSTLYGSQAMGGVINIITTNPENAPLLSVQAASSTHSEHEMSLSVAPQVGKHKTLINTSLHRTPEFVDENKDGFSDFTMDTRFTFFNKWNFRQDEFRELNLAAKYYFEERLGGTRQYTHELRGSDSVYGESIYTNRLELFGTYDLPLGFTDLELSSSYAWHDQDSWYGDYHYTAEQQTLFSNLIWRDDLTRSNDLMIGATFRYDVLDQTFNGQRLDGGSVDRRFVPGLFTQYDHILSEEFRALAGLRLDHHGDHGFIFSPRLNLKFTPDSHTTLRLNTGTGFRIVNLFTEEHEALTGSRQVVVAESLNPEESYNIALNLNRIIDIGPSVLNADLDVFYTRFSNQIIPDYSESNKIIYTNLDGHSVSRGVSLSLAHNFITPLTYMIGFTVQDVYREEGGIQENLPFSPDYSGVFSLSYSPEGTGLTFDYTGRLNGPMHLPEYEGKQSVSPVYTEQNLKVSRNFGDFTVYIAGQNLTDRVQPDPLIAPDRPFSDEFATDYVYGPVQGRRFMAGIQLTLD